MKKLFQVTCCGKAFAHIDERNSIYVIAEDEKEAGNKTLNRMKELKYDNIDDFVSNIKLIADSIDKCRSLLVL